MLDANFPGAAELRSQMVDLCVETVDSDGSVRLEPSRRVSANVSAHIPVEMELPGDDGISTFALLHVQAGLLAELEIYREDGSRTAVKEPLGQFLVVVH